MKPEDLGLVFEAARLSVEFRLMTADLMALEARRNMWLARARKLEEQVDGTELQAVAGRIEGGGE